MDAKEKLQRRIFTRLLRPYLEKLYRQAYWLTRNQQDAEDVVQDVLIKLFGLTTIVRASRQRYETAKTGLVMVWMHVSRNGITQILQIYSRMIMTLRCWAAT
ncbi:MAG: sigma factor [Gammaproteobacteria bacterium]|jgi:hypothetical protein|nr:hypothetical protein [Chromatiales bacterium]MDP6674639.1 sigma factor [Gammaproteobacteria bacterium]